MQIKKYFNQFISGIGKLFSHKSKIKLDKSEVIDIIKTCRLLGVQELRVDGLLIKFPPVLNSELKTPEKSQNPESPTITPIKKTTDSDRERDYDIQMLEDPSGFMQAVENGEINLADVIGKGLGEEV